MSEIASFPRDIELLRQACKFLAECRDLDELKSLKDKAESLRMYYAKQKDATAAENAAGTIVLRAARRIGEVSREIEKSNPGNRKKDLGLNMGPKSKKSILDEVGIKRAEAFRCEGIAEIPSEEFEESIILAQKNGKSITLSAAEKVGRARKKKDKRLKAVADIASEPPPFPCGPFRVIVVDPPWTYTTRPEDATHRAANPYPSMTIDQIKSLDVPSLSANDCVLWLWTTNAHMRQSFEVVDAWGFSFKTILTWVKHAMGLGDWLRGQTEHCLMSVRGKPVVMLTNQTTAIHGNLRKHSQKPDEFYALVESLCPGSKLEMFSRARREGWVGYGNESLR